MTYELITSTRQLNAACIKLSQSDVIAVDTEFKRETTYFPIPCLFQLASSQHTFCIDPFEIDNLEPIKALFADETILKVFHAGRQDLEIFYYLFETLPKPVFDTQIAAAILGFPAQVGYAKLVCDYLHIELDKSLTRADWERRPLPQKQLEYAANDVIYLLQVYEKQIKALKSSNRLRWPDSDNEALLDHSLYRPDPSSAWKKLRNHHLSNATERQIASEIAQWREAQAIKRNRPRKYIFDNTVISEIAIHQPTTLNDMKQLDNVPSYVTRKFGKELLTLVQKGLNAREEVHKHDFQQLTEAENKLVKAMQKHIKQIAEQENIEASVICSKKEIEKLVRGKTLLPVLSGWRYNLVGKTLSEMKAINDQSD